MIRRVSQTLALALLVGDLFAIGAAWVCAYYLRFSGGLIAVEKDVPEERLMWESLPVVLIPGGVRVSSCGQYKIDRLRRFVRKSSQPSTVAFYSRYSQWQRFLRGRTIIARGRRWVCLPY